ncbi:cation diffusion facilitator family transporter [Legionella jordanis]|uniref:Cation efflux family protein n=1 Tax=Legionella jordanis TaxID=456 RepID=A0A0W0V9G9_9GAMM|nr:cation diffusion facilitator family transporter [Legionella jordanis]KTD16782.1 cation efflux family protein [Legionella jordanis]RMX03690.1 cation transporter [Legionella jordanis]RMX22248.1 cation transporter [Legionella jordanis]VEH11750.1 cation efflux family protein [Legionella jordanis]
MQEQRYQQARNITIIGAVVNALLGGVKLLGGVVYHSHALAADGIHSFSDLITDFMVLFASKYGSQDADESHPYGHQRIETAATLILALLLILAGAGIAWDSFYEILYATHTKPGWIAFPIALLSIFANEILFHWTLHVGKSIQSSLLTANAWHHRSDAAASIVVALGLLGTFFGFLYLDAIAAIIVGFMIIKMGITYGWDSVKELIDTAVDAPTLQKIEEIIQSVPGVEKIHQLRSRLMGGDVFIDVHILVSPFISVSEGHYIAQHVHRSLLKGLARVKDVTVHVDPEDDEENCPSFHLPSRKAIEKEFITLWKVNYPGLTNWTLHYLEGKMVLDLIFAEQQNWPSVLEKIRQNVTGFPHELTVRIFNQQGMIEHEQS